MGTKEVGGQRGVKGLDTRLAPCGRFMQKEPENAGRRAAMMEAGVAVAPFPAHTGSAFFTDLLQGSTKESPKSAKRRCRATLEVLCD